MLLQHLHTDGDSEYYGECKLNDSSFYIGDHITTNDGRYMRIVSFFNEYDKDNFVGVEFIPLKEACDQYVGIEYDEFKLDVAQKELVRVDEEVENPVDIIKSKFHMLHVDYEDEHDSVDKQLKLYLVFKSMSGTSGSVIGNDDNASDSDFDMGDSDCETGHESDDESFASEHDSSAGESVYLSSDEDEALEPDSEDEMQGPNDAGEYVISNESAGTNDDDDEADSTSGMECNRIDENPHMVEVNPEEVAKDLYKSVIGKSELCFYRFVITDVGNFEVAEGVSRD